MAPTATAKKKNAPTQKTIRPAIWIWGRRRNRLRLGERRPSLFCDSEYHGDENNQKYGSSIWKKGIIR